MCTWSETVIKYLLTIFILTRLIPLYSSMQVEEADHIPVKPKKKLAGAVSMFGSIDPTMVGRKTTIGSPPLAAKPTLPKRPGKHCLFGVLVPHSQIQA